MSFSNVGDSGNIRPLGNVPERQRSGRTQHNPHPRLEPSRRMKLNRSTLKRVFSKHSIVGGDFTRGLRGKSRSRKALILLARGMQTTLRGTGVTLGVALYGAGVIAPVVAPIVGTVAGATAGMMVGGPIGLVIGGVGGFAVGGLSGIAIAAMARPLGTALIGISTRVHEPCQREAHYSVDTDTEEDTTRSIGESDSDDDDVDTDTFSSDPLPEELSSEIDELTGELNEIITRSDSDDDDVDTDTPLTQRSHTAMDDLEDFLDSFSEDSEKE